MTDGITSAAWPDRRAVVTFPERVGAPDAAGVGAQLLAALSGGAEQDGQVVPLLCLRSVPDDGEDEMLADCRNGG